MLLHLLSSAAAAFEANSPWLLLLLLLRCCRAASTKQSKTTTFDSTLVLEPTRVAAWGYKPPPSFHKVTFVRDSSIMLPDEVIAVRDEQGNDVTFVLELKNKAVLGGGLVHVVNAVSMQSGKL
jgi:transcriptional regulator of nitric oxide reductase